MRIMSMLAVVLATLLTTSLAFADEATEDILYMNDGRELHGQIISETRTEVVFQLVYSGIKSTVTFRMDEISKIERDVAVAGEEEEAAEEKPRQRTTAKDEEDEKDPRTYGALRGDDPSLPSFYVVPMKGQVGTDIHIDAYRPMVDDIRAFDPDFLVIEIDCADEEDRLYSRLDPNDAGLADSSSLDMYRKIMNLFHDELRDIPQVVWVKDSIGIASVLALSWNNLYMHSDASLGGLRSAARFFEGARDDPDKFGKFREAYMAWLRGYVENSNRDTRLVDAMVMNEPRLSATWSGRDVSWSLDANGEYIVDNNPNATVNFNARSAANFCISEGTADSLDDLAIMLGLREYRVCDGVSETVFDDYTEDWRRALAAVAEEYEGYVEAQQFANGEDAVRYLGKAKRHLEKIVSYMDRFEAVELRAMMEVGVRKFDIETQIELLKEQLTRLSRARRGTGRRGAPGSGGGLGGGG